MTQVAHVLGLKVIVDVVFNHMANADLSGHPHLDYPQFSARDFHQPQSHQCIQDFNTRFQVTNFWLCAGNGDSGLPDLDTSSPYVRSVERAYLDKLIALGADGFRFDAAKHIEPEFFADVLKNLPKSMFSYGEVIADSADDYQLYTPYLAVTDFNLLSTMIAAFSYQGDLRNLVFPSQHGGEVPGNTKVVFARNHDTAMSPSFYNFGDLHDSLLASAFILGRGVGVPFIYRDDYRDPFVTAAIKFHNLFDGKDVYVRRADEVCPQACDARTLLFVERGRSGLMIINSANQMIDAPLAFMPGLDPGCYTDLDQHLKVSVGKNGSGMNTVTQWDFAARKKSGGFTVDARSVLFLTRASADFCK